MTIISKFKDFYDFVHFQPDKYPYWERHTENKHFNFFEEAKELVGDYYFDNPIPNYLVALRKEELQGTFQNQPVTLPPRDVWHSKRSQDWQSRLFLLVGPKVFVGNILVEGAFEESRYSLRESWDKCVYGKVDQLKPIVTWIEGPPALTHSFQVYAKKHKSPLLLYRAPLPIPGDYKWTLEVNPSVNWLKEVFPVDVYTLYQLVETTLNEWNSTEIPNRVGSDKIAAASKGFDEYSFVTNRKRPNG